MELKAAPTATKPISRPCNGLIISVDDVAHSSNSSYDPACLCQGFFFLFRIFNMPKSFVLLS